MQAIHQEVILSEVVAISCLFYCMVIPYNLAIHINDTEFTIASTSKEDTKGWCAIGGIAVGPVFQRGALKDDNIV